MSWVSPSHHWRPCGGIEQSSKDQLEYRCHALSGLPWRSCPWPLPITARISSCTLYASIIKSQASQLIQLMSELCLWVHSQTYPEVVILWMPVIDFFCCYLHAEIHDQPITCKDSKITRSQHPTQLLSPYIQGYGIALRTNYRHWACSQCTLSANLETVKSLDYSKIWAYVLTSKVHYNIFCWDGIILTTFLLQKCKNKPSWTLQDLYKQII